jgi:DNA polymerase III alpha subunit
MASEVLLRPYFIRKIPDTNIYQDRIQEEFALIDRFRFTRVFQQVHEILNIARERQIPHIIRGSAGSSLVCYAMGITEIDPILYGLELARFMNTGRQDLPDIDIDVPYNRREELYTEIGKRWPNKVARISNHVSYRAKVALRESAKEVLLEQIPKQADLRDQEQKKKLRSLQRRQFQLSKILSPEDEEKARALAKEKEGTIKHHSLHCGGIVIFETEDHVPEDLLLKTEPFQQIRLNKDETEEQGYIKIDILSNRGLAQLVDTQEKPRGLLEYPTRDPETERIFARGDTIGLTFSESRGMRKIVMGMRPRHMDDIAIALALIRPAAATRGRKAEFLERWKHGEEHTTNTMSGHILFDDDAIGMIRTALDCTAAEADKWRKVFAKQNPAGRIQFRQRLYARGISRATQDHMMEELDYLALYSFCRSHAISYAQLVWALAFEKAHNPHRFWTATLNHCHSEYRKWVHYREAKQSGLQLTRNKGPYRLGQRQGKPALISMSTQGEQRTLSDMFQQTNQSSRDIEDMKEIGYWISESFLPNCGLWFEAQQTIEHWFGSKKEQGQRKVRFRGLIATGRVLRRDGLATLLTIGVENGKYIDLVYPDHERGDLFGWAVVEGKGLYEKRGLLETIEVQSIHGVSLQSLLHA